MPESRKRKRPNPNRAVPRKRLDLTPIYPAPEPRTPPKVNRDPAVEIPIEKRPPLPELPEPASYDAVLVALADLDPLAQETMIGQRLGVFPHPSDPEGKLPVPIHRNARAPWAHHLRKLGIFCIPELATHEVVLNDPVTGVAQHLTGSSMTQRIDENGLWQAAIAAEPGLAELVENAKTPEQKEAAMRKLEAKLPVAQRIALQRLRAARPEDLEPK